MPTVYPLNWQPYLDKNWSVNPGCCTAMTGFMQQQTGTLACVRVTSSFGGFSVTGSDALHAQVFGQTSGSSRFLVFRVQNIDEYTNAGARTNRGTGYSASTTDWSAAAYGNQIIACNYYDATQSSTGAGFSGLGGGSPKARYIAANVNFVMLADVDDGGSNVFTDMVWWSGLRNPNTYTPSQATQAGNIRLLDAPGPIRNVVAFGDKFVAFKDNAIFVGQYIGPPYVWGWKLVSPTVGLSYPKAVTVCDGRIYFVHVTGIYSFDGQQIRNISTGQWPAINGESTQSDFRLRGDDIDGNVWVVGFDKFSGAGTERYLQYAYSFNTRTGLWARTGLTVTTSNASTSYKPPVVYGTTAEYRGFTTLWSTFSGYAWLDNNTPQVGVLTGGTTTDVSPAITTGFIGSNDGLAQGTRVWPRLFLGSGSDKFSSAHLNSYETEGDTAAAGTATLTYNSRTGSLDGSLAGRFLTTDITFATNRSYSLSGVGFELVKAGRV